MKITAKYLQGITARDLLKVFFLFWTFDFKNQNQLILVPAWLGHVCFMLMLGFAITNLLSTCIRVGSLHPFFSWKANMKDWLADKTPIWLVKFCFEHDLFDTSRKVNSTQIQRGMFCHQWIHPIIEGTNENQWMFY